jgi:hypothetical protein
MDYVQAVEIASDLANSIIRGNYQISDNNDEIREILDNNVVMDHILGSLTEHYGEGTEAEARFERFQRYNRNILENSENSENDPSDNVIINNIDNILTPTSPRSPVNSTPIPIVAPLNTSSISETTISSLPDHVQTIITCPLTQQIMSDPVMDSQGNTYERSAIEQWIATRSPATDPLNRQPITNILIPNMAIRSLIQLYIPTAGGRRKLTKKKKLKKSKKYRKSRKR